MYIKKYTKHLFFKIIFSTFGFFTIFSFIYIFLTSIIDINPTLKKDIIDREIKKKEIFQLINKKQEEILHNKKFNEKFVPIYQTNYFGIFVKNLNEVCVLNKIKPRNNDFGIENNDNNIFNFDICFDRHRYSIQIKFEKKYFIIKHYIILLILSFLISIMAVLTDFWHLIKVKDIEEYALKNKIVTSMGELTIMKEYLINGDIEIIIDFFRKRIKQNLYNLELIKKILEIIPLLYLMNNNEKVYFGLKKLLFEIENTYQKLGIGEIKLLGYYLSKRLDMEYYYIHKKYLKWLGMLINLISSKFYTSGFQLLLFIIIFSAIHAVFLGIIIGNSNFIYNLYETISILSNLGGDISFNSEIGFIYGIYLQIIGVIFFGVLVNIIGKKISF